MALMEDCPGQTVLNQASTLLYSQGTKFGNVNTEESLFAPHGIKFMGVKAHDNMGKTARPKARAVGLATNFECHNHLSALVRIFHH